MGIVAEILKPATNETFYLGTWSWAAQMLTGLILEGVATIREAAFRS